MKFHLNRTKLRLFLFGLLCLFVSGVFAEDVKSFRTPDWKSAEKVDAWVWPRNLSDLLKVVPEDDCIVVDSSSLESAEDFRNVQMNVPGINVQTIQNKTVLFTLDLEGPKDAPMNLYLEGQNSEGKFMAVMIRRGPGNSLVLRGKRQTERFLAHLPDGIKELHWRFDFFKPGVFRIFSMKADFIPQPDPKNETAGKPELLFYVPFDGNTKPAVAAGSAEPVVSKNIEFCEGIRGLAADFSAKNHSLLSYPLAKNLIRERGTISVWLRRNPVERDSWRTILSMPWDSDTRIGSGAIWFWLWSGRLRADTSDVLDSCLLSDLPETDGWIHVVMTWNPFERGIFVNGKQIHGGRRPDKRLDPLLPLIYRPMDFDHFDVGQFRGFNWLEGKLDELKIFSEPLSAEEVSELYRQERSLGLTVSKRYFFDDVPAAISGSIENTGEKAQSLTLHLRNHEGTDMILPLILNAGKGSTHFSFTLPPQKDLLAKMQAAESPNSGKEDESEGSIHVSFNLPPQLTVGGASTWTLSLEQKDQTLESRSIHFFSAAALTNAQTANAKPDAPSVTPECESATLTSELPLQLELLETIDPLTLGEDRLAFVGTHSTGELNGRKYLQVGPNYEERFAIRLPKMVPDQLYCLDVEIPDDCQRTVDLIAQDVREPRCTHYELHSGWLTGDEYSCSNQFLTQRLLFRARSAENALLFMTARKGEGGAAVAQIRVSRVTEPLPHVAIQPPKPIRGWTRPVGVYFEDCALGYDFGASLGEPESLEKTMHRLCDYMRFTGQNQLTYPIVWYEGRLGKDYFARPHAPEYFDAMLTMFDREGFDFMASINQYRVPIPTPLVTEESLKDGSLNGSAYMIHADGLPNKTHPICLFHPSVEAMMSRYVDEILAEGAPHPSFKGISFHMVFNNLTTFGDLKMGYNDYLIEEFEKDTKISIPVDHKAPNRGKLFADWLLANAREEWIDWRCQKLARWYRSLAQKLADARPDLRLVLNCKVAISYQKNFGLPDEFKGQRDYWEQANREMGIDAKYFKDVPNIVIEQTVFPADYRWLTDRCDETVRDTLRLTETHPGQYGTLREAERPWINFHDRYWESDVGNPGKNPMARNRFHANWLTEHPWRVSTLNPAGFHAMRHYVMPLRYCDVQGFNKGGFLIGTLGMEGPLREFAQAFRSLPAVVFEDVAGSTETVRVRQHSEDGKNWFYVVNTSESPVQVTLKADVSQIRNLGQGKTLTRNGNFWTFFIPPYHLESFCAESEAGISAIRITESGKE